MCNRRSTGKVLGEGFSRIVFEMTNPSADGKAKVLKVAKDKPKVNLTEKAVWDAVKDTEYGKYFMPVLWCSDDGTQLQMYRAANTVWGIHSLQTGCERGKCVHYGTLVNSDLRTAMNFLGIEDIHPMNVVIWNGRQVVIDYSPPWGTPVEYVKERAEKAGWNW